MTTTRTAPTPSLTPTVAQRPLSLWRATAVEVRKMVDTRSGALLFAVAALLAGAFAGGRALFAGEPTTAGALANMAAWPAGLILMVLAVLAVSSEFSRGTAAVTFTLDPHRARVLAAKASAVVAVGILAGALSLLCGLLVGVVAPAVGAPSVDLPISTVQASALVATILFTGLTGFAWALALRNAPAPIVLLLVWPTVATLIAALSPAAAAGLAWVEPQPFLALVLGVETGWAKVLTSSVFWVLAPAAVGAWRLLRDDL